MATVAAGGMPPIAGVSTEALAAENELRHSRIKQLTDRYESADSDLHVDAGMATEYLPRMAAEWHADIVVMGDIARSGSKRLLIGSTAERDLRLHKRRDHGDRETRAKSQYCLVVSQPLSADRLVPTGPVACKRGCHVSQIGG
jgi:Universal stress protein family